MKPAHLIESPEATVPVLLAHRDRYQILGTVGEGASAVVVKAHDLELDEVIALKVLAPKVARDVRVVARLKREIRIARRVRHPNVARVYDLEEWDGRLCISMEYIEGGTLELCLRRAPLAWPDAVTMLSTIALALESAHDLDVVHRDLKPANILLDKLQRPYLLDFGIAIGPGAAESTATNVITGSPAYMGPERWRENPGMAASDLYSLGIVAYEMVTGQQPYRADSLRLLMSQHLHSPVPALVKQGFDVPPAFDELVQRLLAKRPEDRPASASEVVRALKRMVPARRRDPGRTRGRVLIVEDEVAVRRLLGDVLRTRGCEVTEASDGTDGLEKAAAERPDLVLLDIGMPGLDGVSVLRALKENPATAGRPVVMLSGSVDPNHPGLARGLGAVAFLNKPVNPDVLDLVLDKYLG